MAAQRAQPADRPRRRNQPGAWATRKGLPVLTYDCGCPGPEQPGSQILRWDVATRLLAVQGLAGTVLDRRGVRNEIDWGTRGIEKWAWLPMRPYDRRDAQRGTAGTCTAALCLRLLVVAPAGRASEEWTTSRDGCASWDMTGAADTRLELGTSRLQKTVTLSGRVKKDLPPGCIPSGFGCVSSRIWGAFGLTQAGPPCPSAERGSATNVASRRIKAIALSIFWGATSTPSPAASHGALLCGSRTSRMPTSSRAHTGRPRAHTAQRPMTDICCFRAGRIAQRV